MNPQPVWLALGVCLTGIFLAATAEEFVIRDTVYGKIRGYVQTVFGSKKVERYLGVPYTAAPVGELRFEDPQELTPWTGIRNTTTLPPACPQTVWGYIHMHVVGFKHHDEDCLYMNLYVPQTGGADKKMAVLVHVHGGSNEAGMGAMFDGGVLAAAGEIIVVNFNYRLGHFGFMSGEGPEFPGNYGLLDQTAALKWVNRNIHYFGGDPAKVTVEGHSAAGGDVGFHIVTPLSKGLFRYAIMQSGSPVAYWALLRPPVTAKDRTIRFAENLGCTTKHDMLELKRCLKTKDWRRLIEVSYGQIPGRVKFRPVIDNKFILSDIDTAILRPNGESFMTGVTRDEGSFRASSVMSREAGAVTSSSVLKVKSVTSFDINLNLVVHEYKPWDDPDNKTAAKIAMSHIVGDSMFVAPAVDVANRLSEKMDNVYMYSFEYHSPLTPELPWIGVHHGRDQFYLFGSPIVGHPLQNFSEEDRQVSRTFMNMWSNYVKTGKPTLTIGGDTIEFPRYNAKSQIYMKITGINGNGSITTAQRLRARKVAFWNTLPHMRDNLYLKGSYDHLTWILAAICGVLFLCLIASIACTLHYRRQYSPTAIAV